MIGLVLLALQISSGGAFLKAEFTGTPRAKPRAFVSRFMVYDYLRISALARIPSLRRGGITCASPTSRSALASSLFLAMEGVWWLPQSFGERQRCCSNGLSEVGSLRRNCLPPTRFSRSFVSDHRGILIALMISLRRVSSKAWNKHHLGPLCLLWSVLLIQQLNPEWKGRIETRTSSSYCGCWPPRLPRHSRLPLFGAPGHTTRRPTAYPVPTSLVRGRSGLLVGAAAGGCFDGY